MFFNCGGAHHANHLLLRKPFGVMWGLEEDLHLAFLCKNISVEGPVGHAFESSDGFCQISSFLLYYLP
jgi:hypothetical protein